MIMINQDSDSKSVFDGGHSHCPSRPILFTEHELLSVDSFIVTIQNFILKNVSLLYKEDVLPFVIFWYQICCCKTTWSWVPNTGDTIWWLKRKPIPDIRFLTSLHIDRQCRISAMYFSRHYFALYLFIEEHFKKIRRFKLGNFNHKLGKYRPFWRWEWVR